MLRHFSLVLTLFLLMFSSANALEQGNTIHPVIGEKTPKELTAADILALPENERLAWVHGAVSLMIQTAASHSPETARCVMDWYFEDSSGVELIIFSLKQYPERSATGAIFATARLACNAL